MKRLFKKSFGGVSIEDREIVALFFKRDENAIRECKKKYGSYCSCIAYNILSNFEDAEECLSDALIGAWNSIPPNFPSVLRTYLGRLTRNSALKRLRDAGRKKRGGKNAELCFEELSECISETSEIYERIEAAELGRVISGFLRGLPESERKIFVLRYWYFEGVSDIAKEFDFSIGKVKTLLYRTRQKLLLILKEEGVNIEDR